MESSATQFEESVFEIDGLTNFCQQSLPAWLRAELMEFSHRDMPSNISDEDLVRNRLAPDTTGRWAWLYMWGSAAINGQSVFLFETDYLTEPVCIAADNRWGVTFLEPSERYSNDFFTAYFFQRGRLAVSDELTGAREASTV